MTKVQYSSRSMLDIFTGMRRKDLKLSKTGYLRVKNLGILRRSIQTVRGTKGGRHKERKFDLITGRNAENIVTLGRVSDGKIFLTVGCVNTRSIRNKTSDLVTSMVDDNYDICMITETWLREDDSVKRAECTLPGLNFQDVPRTDRNGGGIGLLYKSRFKASLINSGCKTSLEFAEWKLKNYSEIITVVTIYRPPYSTQHPVTVRTFISFHFI